MKTEFKTEWSQQDFKIVNKAIQQFIRSRYFETFHSPDANPFAIMGESWASIENVLGLAYTSSGMWACYSLCNTSLYLDAAQNWTIEFFTLSKVGDFVFAVCWDKDENEILIPIN